MSSQIGFLQCLDWYSHTNMEESAASFDAGKKGASSANSRDMNSNRYSPQTPAKGVSASKTGLETVADTLALLLSKSSEDNENEFVGRFGYGYKMYQDSLAALGLQEENKRDDVETSSRQIVANVKEHIGTTWSGDSHDSVTMEKESENEEVDTDSAFVMESKGRDKTIEARSSELSEESDNGSMGSFYISVIPVGKTTKEEDKEEKTERNSDMKVKHGTTNRATVRPELEQRMKELKLATVGSPTVRSLRSNYEKKIKESFAKKVERKPIALVDSPKCQNERMEPPTPKSELQKRMSQIKSKRRQAAMKKKPNVGLLWAELEESIEKFQARLRSKNVEEYRILETPKKEPTITPFQSELSAAAKQLRKVLVLEKTNLDIPVEKETAAVAVTTEASTPTEEKIQVETVTSEEPVVVDTAALSIEEKQADTESPEENVEMTKTTTVRIEEDDEPIEEEPPASFLGAIVDSFAESSVSGRITVVLDELERMIVKAQKLLQHKKKKRSALSHKPEKFQRGSKAVTEEHAMQLKESQNKAEEAEKLLETLEFERREEVDKMTAETEKRTNEDHFSVEIFSVNSAADSFDDVQIKSVYSGAATEKSASNIEKKKMPLRAATKSNQSKGSVVNSSRVDKSSKKASVDVASKRSKPKWKAFMQKRFHTQAEF